MDPLQIISFDSLGKLVSVVLALAGAWWAFEKWRKRDEHFPRMYFEVSVNFLGLKDEHVVCELLATLENKGVVPLRIRKFSFLLRGLNKQDPVERGDDTIRNQIIFPHRLEEGVFVPRKWNFTFIYPGVKTEYNFVTAIPRDTEFVRMQGDFEYLRSGRSHHAAKILRVPHFSE